ncbi:MAG: glycosyltransferase family 4 protein [Verrucomicrobiales bacterium]|nr:glycosyltransferase family 4 protein [Verrucomicrobiales bacterium]
MRFVVVTLGLHPDVVGGAWRVAAEQAAGLVKQGHSVEVVTVDPDGSLPQVETRRGVRIRRYRGVTGHFYRKWRTENRLASDLIREALATSSEPVLLIQHHAYLEPAVASGAAGVPVLHVFHGPWAEEYRFAARVGGRGLVRRWLDQVIPAGLRRVERRALDRARRILVLSGHFRRQLGIWHRGVDETRVEVVPGGVDFTRFQVPADRAALRKAWGLEERTFLFVTLRRLDPRMGLDLLIEAFARVQAASGPGRAQLWLAGKGPAEAALVARIRALKLDASVKLLGFLPDAELPRLLGAADATVMPSLDLEGFGLATAESLACGTPVLGSRAGATPELLEPLDAGCLFAPGSVDELVRALGRALDNPGALPDRGRCADYARGRFSWEHQVAACERAGRELFKASGGA